MKNDQIELTLSNIVDIINGGKAEHSPLAKDFIKKVNAETALDIVACYPFIYERNEFDGKGKPTDDFYDIVSLEIYFRIQNEDIDRKVRDKETEKIIFDAFYAALEEHGVEINYFPRVLSAQETDYYGFQHTALSQINMSIVKKPSALPKRKDHLEIRSYDELALWHIYNKAKNMIFHSFYFRFGYKIKTFLYYESDSTFAHHAICFDTRSDLESFMRKHNEKSAAKTVYSAIKSFDRSNVLSFSNYVPRFYSWDDIVEDKRFGILRDF